MNIDRCWWEEIEKCKGINKNGSRCNNYARKAMEIEPGHLIVFFTCSKHQDQEEQFKKI
jgi:hypothetical protein